MVQTQEENFKLAPEHKAQLDWLRMALGGISDREAIERAISILVTLKRQMGPGSQLFVRTREEQVRLLIPELEPEPQPNWQYLVERPHPWRRQLYLKGRKLMASTVWLDAIANEMSPEEAADNWELPLAAIEEVFRYCQTHQDLLKMEAEEERLRLQEKGVSLEPKTTPG